MVGGRSTPSADHTGLPYPFSASNYVQLLFISCVALEEEIRCALAQSQGAKQVPPVHSAQPMFQPTQHYRSPQLDRCRLNWANQSCYVWHNSYRLAPRQALMKVQTR